MDLDRVMDQLGIVLKGHEFTRAAKSAQMNVALATEGRFF
jgi:hypothetical protein